MSKGKYDGKTLRVLGQPEHYETCTQDEVGGVVQITCPLRGNTLPMPEIVLDFGIEVQMVEVV